MRDSERAPTTIIPFAAVLVEEHGKYILVEEAHPDFRHTWYLPAGHVDPGEDVADAAIRETLEEAGLEVALDGLLCIDRDVLDGDDRRERWRFTFVAHPIGGSLKTEPDAESLQAQWFRPGEMAELPLRNSLLLERIQLHHSGPSLLPIDRFMRRIW